MSNQLKEQELLSELDGDLHEAVRLVRLDVPEEESVRESVDRMKTLVEETVANVPNPQRSMSLRQRVLSKAGWFSIVAASLLIGLGVLSLIAQPKLTLAAQIANSIAAQDWVKATETFEDGGQLVAWFSPSLNRSGLSNQEKIEYRDHGSGECYEFVRADQTIYRVSESQFPRQYSRWAKLATSLPTLLADGLPDHPMTKKMLGMDDLEERLEFQGHRIEPSADGAKLEYSIQCLLEKKPLEIVFYVDAKTKLPIRSVMTGLDNGKKMSNTIELSYPEAGPKNIYDLGAPANAKLVNRIESEIAQFLRDAVRAGTDKFDDYRATMVKHRVGDPVWWLNADVEVVCRKGDRFTRRHVEHDHVQRGNNGPGKDADVRAWWEQKVATARNGPDGHPYNVVIGEEIWDFDRESKTYEKRRHGNDDFHCWSLRPDMIARPPMGGSSNRMEIRIDEDPDTGPAGTILYEIIRSKGGDVTRNWIDPKRGYLVVQTESGPAEQWSRRTTVEKATQSPSGIWYPQRLLTKWCRDNKVTESITNCYVDFESEIPDRMFKIK